MWVLLLFRERLFCTFVTYECSILSLFFFRLLSMFDWNTNKISDDYNIYISTWISINMIRNENQQSSSSFEKSLLTFFFYFVWIVDDNLGSFLFDLVHHYYSTWCLKINWWSHEAWLEKILITMICSSNNHFSSSFHATRIIISYKKHLKNLYF